MLLNDKKAQEKYRTGPSESIPDPDVTSGVPDELSLTAADHRERIAEDVGKVKPTRKTAA